MLKNQLIAMILIGGLTGLSNPMAYSQEWECVKPATSGYWKKDRKPAGNWGPQHKVSNWTYRIVNGQDYYQHKNGKRAVGTKCKGGFPNKFNYGEQKIDLDDKQDWCATWVPGQAKETTTPSCPTGHSIDSTASTCSKQGTSGYWKKNRKPAGNWGPHHTTSKWTYQVVNGQDYYRHRRGKRAVGTKCKGSFPKKFNYGTQKIDLDGNQDWCATWVAPQPARASISKCPAGFERRLKEDSEVLEDAKPTQFEWTPWLNRDGPSGSGDHENLQPHVDAGNACETPAAVECRLRDNRQPASSSGEVVTCTKEKGFICRAKEQPDGRCQDHEVRFSCPAK